MKKHIAEDLPARKHPQAQMSAQSKAPEKSERGSGGGDDKGEKTPEQRIRQAVYDIRYRDWETDRKSTRLNSSHRL